MGNFSHNRFMQRLNSAPVANGPPSRVRKEWKTTEPAQLSPAPHLRMKLALNTALSTTHSSAHEIELYPQREDRIWQTPITSTALGSCSSATLNNPYGASLIRADQVNHCSSQLLSFTKSDINSKTVSADSQRESDYLHDLHSDDCLPVI